MYNSRLYRNAPIKLQENLLSIRSLIRNSLREGRYFLSILKYLEESQWKNSHEIIEIKKLKLVSALQLATTSVPFYKKLEIDESYFKLPSVNLLSKFPIIDKEVVKSENTQFLSSKFNFPKIKRSI